MRPPSLAIKYLAKKHARKLEEIQNNPSLTQKKVLDNIKEIFSQTKWDSKFRISEISSPRALAEEFKNTSDTDYDDMILKIREQNTPGAIQQGPLEYMAKTSGSTAKSKYIPYPKSLIKNFQRFSFETFLHFSHSRAVYNLMQGYLLVSPSNLTTERNDCGIHIGTGTGIMTSLAPKFTRSIVRPSLKNLNHNSFEEKIDAMVKEAINLDIRSFTCAPAFAVPILEHLFNEAQKSKREVKDILDIWPNLKFYSFSGSSVIPYERTLRSFLGDKIPFLEIYSATESPIAYQYDPNRPGELYLDLESCFFLFQKEGTQNDSRRFNISELEVGSRYRLLITTYGGLINYELGDIIEVTSLKPVLIKIIGREKEEANIAGTERLSLATIREHLNWVFDKYGLSIDQYFLSSYTDDDGKIGYLWTFETDQTISNDLISDLDTNLMKLNSGYKASRDSDVRLRPPKVITIPKDSIRRYILEHKSFGQGKFLVVHNDNKDVDLFFAWLNNRK
ncbi:MAG: GH3 auxin-responsive promoter family protein [Bdellovibrionota bacterium]|nr:GH3 auxin-responsive promoter family protein [Bdellovibrionota bacterium]